MSEYIEREAAIKIQCQDCGNYGFCDNDCSTVESIKRVPAADVRPSAKWKLINGLMRCPACGKAPDESYYVSVDGWRYCPICGERLDPPEEGE